jgi:hypothetical protein
MGTVVVVQGMKQLGVAAVDAGSQRLTRTGQSQVAATVAAHEANRPYGSEQSSDDRECCKETQREQKHCHDHFDNHDVLSPLPRC